MHVTRFGLQIPSFTFPGVEDGELFERVAQIAVTAEESGFDSVWVMDHFYQIRNVGPRTDPMFEAYTTCRPSPPVRGGPVSAPWSRASPTATRPCWPRS